MRARRALKSVGLSRMRAGMTRSRKSLPTQNTAKAEVAPKAGSERVTSSAIVGQAVQPAQNLRLVPLSDLVEDRVG
jgi:hypothetical protein